MMKNYFLNVLHKIFHKKPYYPKQFNHPGNIVYKQTKAYKITLLKKMLIIFGVPVIALLFSLLVFRIYHVKGPSMEDTLFSGQRIIIQKWDKTYADLLGRPYAPNRYDVVVVNEPDDPATQVVKRVIGLPGDRVVISAGRLIIINNQHPSGYDADSEGPSGVVEAGELTEGKVDVALGPKEIFVLGDNRNNSKDSRDFGPVPTELIQGKFLTRIGF